MNYSLSSSVVATANIANQTNISTSLKHHLTLKNPPSDAMSATASATLAASKKEVFFDKKPVPLKLASVKNPAIAAIIDGLFRFQSEAQALARLEKITRGFICCTKQPEHGLSLWVKGAYVTSKEKKEGYYGHVVLVRPHQLRDGSYTLIAAKEQVPLAQHPQRRRKKAAHPNWGHPTLRHAKEKTLFDTADAALFYLTMLHKEFPNISIPGKGKCYIIMYQRSSDTDASTSPVQKMVVEVKTNHDGKFYLDCRKNSSKKRVPAKQRTASNPQMSEEGYFTAMVSLKRKVKQAS